MTTAYTREEVASHNTDQDEWLIVDDKIYNITNFKKKHPGGRVISFYKGQDATDPVRAFHPDTPRLEKYMKPLLIGTLSEKSYKDITPLVKDFRELREEFMKEGKFKSSPLFYWMQIFQVVFLELLGVLIIWKMGNSWLSILLASLVLGTSQAQAGWNQHDYGHLSVFFRKIKVNHLMHQITIGHFKGASAEWWKTRHNRHHAKTNVVHLDPDLHTEPVFIWSDSLLKKGWKLLPYQHLYWWFLGPPLVTTLIFVPQNLRYVLTYGLWSDLFWMLSFFVRFGWTYSHFLSGWDCMILYFSLRFWESHWFTWVTSMSHLPRPMRVEHVDQNWISLNANSTQNITADPFHDWFTGHLNYQLEHHLFPTMPRHHLKEISPKIQALCEKYKLPYHVRSMYQCCCDIVEKLVRVGKQFEKQHMFK